MQPDSIGRILDEMHEAVLAGQYTQLGEMAEALEQQLQSLSRSDRALLQVFSSKAARNSACLRAAASGIRAALRRLSEVHQTSTELVTYDGCGKKASALTTGQMARRF